MWKPKSSANHASKTFQVLYLPAKTKRSHVKLKRGKRGLITTHTTWKIYSKAWMTCIFQDSSQMVNRHASRKVHKRAVSKLRRRPVSFYKIVHAIHEDPKMVGIKLMRCMRKKTSMRSDTNLVCLVVVSVPPMQNRIFGEYRNRGPPIRGYALLLLS